MLYDGHGSTFKIKANGVPSDDLIRQLEGDDNHCWSYQDGYFVCESDHGEAKAFDIQEVCHAYGFDEIPSYIIPLIGNEMEYMYQGNFQVTKAVGLGKVLEAFKKCEEFLPGSKNYKG